MKKVIVSVLAAFMHFFIWIICQTVTAIYIKADAVLGTVISGLLFIAVSVTILLIRSINIKDRLEINKLSLKSAGFVVLISLVFNLILQSTQLLFPETVRLELIKAAEENFVGNKGMIFLAVVLIAPITEELLFRGLMFGILKKNMNVYSAAIIQGLVFGIMHGHFIWMIFAGITALFYAFLMEKYKSLSAPILGHISVNLLSFLFM